MRTRPPADGGIPRGRDRLPPQQLGGGGVAPPRGVRTRPLHVSGVQDGGIFMTQFALTLSESLSETTIKKILLFFLEYAEGTLSGNFEYRQIFL